MKRFLKRAFIVLLMIYGFICISVYIFQEKLLFFPEKLSDDYTFQFYSDFTEQNIKSTSGNILNGLLFTADSAKGLVVYFHGNGGSLERWGTVSEEIVPRHYELLIIDYPGYGKSKGKMSEENLYADAQSVYDFAKTKFGEDKITVYGRSIGTGIAAHLASENSPHRLILEAPYYSMNDLSSRLYPFLPSFILRYPLRTDLFLPKVKCPVTVFHGSDDEIIYEGSSEKLKPLLKHDDKVFIIAGGHHNDLKLFDEFQNQLSKTLQ